MLLVDCHYYQSKSNATDSILECVAKLENDTIKSKTCIASENRMTIILNTLKLYKSDNIFVHLVPLFLIISILYYINNINKHL